MITKMALESKLPKLIFSFDDLVNNTILYAEKMARFIMGDKLDEAELEERLTCLRLSYTGDFKRKKQTLGMDPFTTQAKKEINKKIMGLASDLKKAGLKPIKDHTRPINES